MIRKEDYLMTQIETMVTLIAKMLHLKIQGKRPEMESVFQDCLTTAGLELEKIKTLSPSEALQGVKDQQMLLQLLEAVNAYTSVISDRNLEQLKAELQKRIAENKIFIAG